jgi:hypothetical protein
MVPSDPGSERLRLALPFLEHPQKPWPAALSPSSIPATIAAMEIDMHWLTILAAIVIMIAQRTLADE